MKRNLLLGAAAAALMSAPAMAGERFDAGVLSGELSANVTLSSNYMFRGISQTDNAPAIQGGFDYVMDNGFYFGTWASNVNFDADPDTDETIEIDYYGGFSNTIYLNECFDKGALEARGCGYPTFTYDLGLIYYTYPRADDDGEEFDFLEFYGKLGVDFGWIALDTGLYYSDEFILEQGEAYYYYAGATLPLEDLLSIPASLDGRVGIQDVDDAGDYTEWEVGLNVTAFTLDWRVAYTSTDQEDSLGDIADDNVYFSVGKSF